MNRQVWFAVALAAALAVIFPAAGAAQWVTVTPPEAGFSADFPATPESSSDSSKPRVHTRFWLNKSGLFVLIGVTDYDAHINTELELELDVKNFITADQGSTLKSQKRLTFSKAPDGPLPAAEFTFTDKAGNGESLIVVSGDRTYQVVVRSPFGHDDKAGMARVLNSFRVLQPSRHWQGD
jgi:hypothetical protein